jgi:hypothetical protein
MDLGNLLLIGSFLLSVSAAIIALSKRKSEINLNEATEADKISAAWERLNKPNETRILDLEKRLGDALKTIDFLQNRVTELETENAELRRQNNNKGLLR